MCSARGNVNKFIKAKLYNNPNRENSDKCVLTFWKNVLEFVLQISVVI